MKTWLVGVFAVGVTIGLASSAALAVRPSAQSYYLPSGTTTVVGPGAVPGNRLRVSVRIALATPGDPFVGDGYWGAVYGKPPKRICSLRAQMNGENVKIPLSSYMDLTNVTAVEVEAGESDGAIVVRGGATASDYVARLIVRNGRIASRRVALGEFESEYWEETLYSFPDWSDSTR